MRESSGAPNSVKLKSFRLLSEIDLYPLAMGAVWWSVHVRAMAAMESSIVQVTDANGRVVIREVGLAKVAFNNVRSILAEFGVGPGSRSKVEALPEDEKDDVAAKYFNDTPSVRRFFGMTESETELNPDSLDTRALGLTWWFKKQRCAKDGEGNGPASRGLRQSFNNNTRLVPGSYAAC